MKKGRVWFRAILAASMLIGGAAHAKDLGDILLKKGLITEEDLKQAREEDKQKTAATESKVEAVLAKIPKWLDSISLFGDMRNRVEGFYGDNYHAETRYRIRARVGLNANVSDEISATVRLATGDPNDPISTNQTLSNTFNRKPFNLDWAYMTIKPGKTFGLEPGWGQIVLGKFGLQMARESELVWDDDLSPEGAMETLNLVDSRDGFFRNFRLNAMQWEINEASTNNDSYMLGGQAALDTAVGSAATWSASFADYSFQGMNRVARTYLSPASSSVNTSLANSNDVIANLTASPSTISAFGICKAGQCNTIGFNIINFGSELNFSNPFGLGIPAGVFGDLAYNTAAESRNSGGVIGLGVGKAGKDWYHDSLRNPGDWGVSYCWEYVEKDAVVSLFSYSDFVYQQVNQLHNVTQKGSTNVEGSIIRLDYVLFPNFQLTAKAHFINALDPGIATSTAGKPLGLIGSSTLTRMQLDAVLKF